VIILRFQLASHDGLSLSYLLPTGVLQLMHLFLCCMTWWQVAARLLQSIADLCAHVGRAPEVLTLHLKRFQQDMRGRCGKINGAVPFPADLDITPYCDPKVIKSPLPLHLAQTVHDSCMPDTIQGCTFTKSTLTAHNHSNSGHFMILFSQKPQYALECMPTGRDSHKTYITCPLVMGVLCGRW
jgi:hypothetical protein